MDIIEAFTEWQSGVPVYTWPVLKGGIEMDVNKQFTALQNNIWDVFCDGEHRLIDKQHNITLKIEEDISYIEIMGHVKAIRFHIESLEAEKAELAEVSRELLDMYSDIDWNKLHGMKELLERTKAAIAKAEGEK